MAKNTMSTQVVDTVADCERVVRMLQREKVIAVDAEGVNLGKTGPLTLLQIGTEGGHVYLFDVQTTPNMFKDGGLKKLLESESVLKVMHSGKIDGEALYWQFGVELREVFDTQEAQMLLDKVGGRRFPQRLKLTEVVSKHCPQKAFMEEGKGDVKTKMNKEEGAYFAKRPLTPEMIEYAANDVLMLIPEVYERQKSLLEKEGLLGTMMTTVEQEILSKRDSAVADKLSAENDEMVEAVLVDFAAKYPRVKEYSDVTDEDVKDALAVLRFDKISKLELPQVIVDLKAQQMQAKLDAVENDLKTQGADYVPFMGVCGMLQAWSRNAPTQSIQDQAIRLLKVVDRILVNDIQKKYTLTSPTAHLARHERSFLLYRLRPESDRDPSVPPVCRMLYWKLMTEELDETIHSYKDDPKKFKMNERYSKKLKFFISGPVPADLKEKARDFLDEMERVGKVPKPAPPSRGRGRGRQQYGRQYRR